MKSRSLIAAPYHTKSSPARKSSLTTLVRGRIFDLCVASIIDQSII